MTHTDTNTTALHATKHARYRPLFAASIAAFLALLVGVLPVYATNDDDDDNDSQQSFSQQSFNRQSVNSCPLNLRVIGLTDDGRLVRFNTLVPHITRNIGVINGLQHPDTALIGIDFRVQDGLLYGVGNGGGVYKINTSTAQVTFVNSLTIPLLGTSFGVDFNPAADRLRIVSDVGQNLRHNVNPGGVTIADGTLTYTPPPADPVAAMGVTASAYTNNDLSPNTATTLFDIDTNLDQVVIQSPANNGILVATGKLGVDVGLPAGFDIYSRLSNGVTVQNCAFATLTTGTPSFYRINLLTGTATRLGSFSAFVVDIAIPLNQQ
ncbi:MAG: DUF4394 domain-containing protein [Nitrospira sp.]|nr:DUF4394 domain-containing protein [Nitrospira sp.]